MSAVVYKKEVIKKLKKLYFKKVFVAGFNSVLNLLSFGAAALFSFTISELLFNFNSNVRTFLFFFFLSLLLITAVAIFVKEFVIKLNIFGGANIYDLAGEAGERFTDIKDSLKNALQLINEKSNTYSAELIEAEFERVFNKIRNYDFSKISRLKIGGEEILKTLLILVVLGLISVSPNINNAFVRLVNYNIEFLQKPEYSFVVRPGNGIISRGDSLKITVKIIGGKHKKPDLFLKSKDDFKFERLSVVKDSLRNFHKNFYSVQNSFHYFFKAGDVVSDTFRIKVIDRPIITNLVVTLKPPAYSGLKTSEQKDDGNISVLKGTIVKWEINSSKILSSASVILGSGNEIPLKTKGNLAFGWLKAMNKEDYYFKLIDTNGIVNSNPIKYSITIEPDDYPEIELVNPKENVSLGADNLIRLQANISDDFGFSKLLLYYKLNFSLVNKARSEFKSLKLPINKELSEESVNYNWDLTPLQLVEGDVVLFYLEVFDNDNVSGPKSAKTKILAIKVPTLDELFNKIDTAQSAASSDLQKTLSEAQSLKENLRKLNFELRKNSKKLDWNEKEKVQKAVKEFKKLIEKSKKIREKIKKLQQEIRKHKLLSRETLKKYEQLQKLFDELDNESLKKAFERMRRMLKSMMRDQVQNALQDVEFNEQAFRKSIERTIKLLKRIQVEEKLDEAIKRTQAAEKREENILKGLKNKASEPLKTKLVRKSKRLQNDLESLKRNLKELEDKMRALKDMPEKELEKVAKKFLTEKNEEVNSRITQNIRRGKFSEAQKSGRKISNNLNNLRKNLAQIKKRMLRNNRLVVMTRMLTAMNNLLGLSKKEEELKNLTKKESVNSPRIDEIAKEQSSLSNGLERVISQISSISEKTFAITPEIGRALSEAQIKMRTSINALENRMNFNAQKQQQSAMKYLNQSVALMQGALRSMMNPSQGSGGMMSLMQQLRQLTQRQMELNKLTQMLKNQKFSMRQLAQMQRLARQQQLIQKSLQELNKEFQREGESKKLTGNLNEIAQNMKEIISRLQSDNIDDNLIKRQQNILSRMLDAQRSIYRRDYEKTRVSTSGKQLRINSPGSLLLNKEIKNRLRDELLKALRSGYSKDYRELIKRYYKLLKEK